MATNPAFSVNDSSESDRSPSLEPVLPTPKKKKRKLGTSVEPTPEAPVVQKPPPKQTTESEKKFMAFVKANPKWIQTGWALDETQKSNIIWLKKMMESEQAYRKSKLMYSYFTTTKNLYSATDMKMGYGQNNKSEVISAWFEDMLEVIKVPPTMLVDVKLLIIVQCIQSVVDPFDIVWHGASKIFDAACLKRLMYGFFAHQRGKDDCARDCKQIYPTMADWSGKKSATSAKKFSKSSSIRDFDEELSD